MPTLEHDEARRELEAAKYKLRLALRHLGPRDFCPAPHRLLWAQESIDTARARIAQAQTLLGPEPVGARR